MLLNKNPLMFLLIVKKKKKSFPNCNETIDEQKETVMQEVLKIQGDFIF